MYTLTFYDDRLTLLEQSNQQKGCFKDNYPVHLYEKKSFIGFNIGING